MIINDYILDLYSIQNEINYIRTKQNKKSRIKKIDKLKVLNRFPILHEYQINIEQNIKKYEHVLINNEIICKTLLMHKYNEEKNIRLRNEYNNLVLEVKKLVTKQEEIFEYIKQFNLNII